MTDQNKSQESEQKWSQEFSEAVEYLICLTGDSRIVGVVRRGIESIAALQAELAHAKQAVDFCSGVHIETLTLMNQSGVPVLNQIVEENQALRAELEQLKAENQILKETHALLRTDCAVKEDSTIRACREVERLRAQLSQVQSQVLFDKDAAEKLSLCGAEVEMLRDKFGQISNQLSGMPEAMRDLSKAIYNLHTMASRRVFIYAEELTAIENQIRAILEKKDETK
jgi:hypothetical protein